MDHRFPKKLKQDESNNVSSSNTVEEQVEDRLSSLPDSLLITILSLLPIDSAAATSAVSRRWRHLWTHLTHISLPPPQKPHFERVYYFFNTVDHILSQLKSPKIHSFEFGFGFELPHGSQYFPYPSLIPQSYLQNLARWIHQICQRDLEIIRFSAFDYQYGRLYRVPTFILQTHSLAQLELYDYFRFVNIPDDGSFSINLPNLKKLRLCLGDSDRWLMGNLCKSCPLLEDLDLIMLDLEKDHRVNVSAPNLKLLSIQMKVRDTWLSKNLAFVIDAPMLEHCHIDGYLMFFDFVEKPTSLRQVTLSIQALGVDSDNDYLSKITGLFQGIYCVESLVLECWPVTLLSSLCKAPAALPIFHNLTHLVIRNLIDRNDRGQRYSNRLPCLPACLLGNLQRLELHGLTGNDLEIKMIQDILIKAIVMEQLHVYNLTCETTEEDTLWREREFCKKLFMLSLCSLSCRIEFSGDAIIASKEDFKDGGLIFRL